MSCIDWASVGATRHPQSIDALCAIPSRYPNAQSTLLTGSSDGLLRAVQLFPTKLLGVVADHGEFPIERIAVDMNGEGRWVGSVGHEEVLKLTDLQEVFADDDDDEDNDEEGENQEGEGVEKSGNDADGDEGAHEGVENGSDDDSKAKVGPSRSEEKDEEDSDADHRDADEDKADSDEEEEAEAEPRKRKRKKEIDPLQAVKRRKGKNEVEAEPAFFADL